MIILLIASQLVAHVKATVDNGEQNLSVVCFETQRCRRSDAAEEGHPWAVVRNELLDFLVAVDKSIVLTASGADEYCFCSAHGASVLHLFPINPLGLTQIAAASLQALLTSIVFNRYTFWSCRSSSFWGCVCLFDHKRLRVSTTRVASLSKRQS